MPAACVEGCFRARKVPTSTQQMGAAALPVTARRLRDVAPYGATCLPRTSKSRCRIPQPVSEFVTHFASDSFESSHPRRARALVSVVAFKLLPPRALKRDAEDDDFPRVTREDARRARFGVAGRVQNLQGRHVVSFSPALCDAGAGCSIALLAHARSRSLLHRSSGAMRQMHLARRWRLSVLSAVEG